MTNTHFRRFSLLSLALIAAPLSAQPLPLVASYSMEFPPTPANLDNRNLLANGGFENGELGGWQAYGSGSQVVKNNARTGEFALQVGAQGGRGGAQFSPTGLAPNTAYELRGFGKVARAGENVRVTMENEGGASVSGGFHSAEFAPFSVRFSTGADASKTKIIFWKDGGEGLAWIDDVSVVRAVDTRALDSGPLGLHLQTQNARVVPGKVGNALFFDGQNSFAQSSAEWMHKLRADFSLTFWAKIERAPQNGNAYLVQKGDNAGWQIGMSNSRTGFLHGYWGGGWYQSGFAGNLPAEWTHVAFTTKKGDRMRLFFNGEEVASDDAPFAFTRENNPFQIGGTNFAGAFDELKIFAAPLSKEQILSDMRGETLRTRVATAADFATHGYGVRMHLARFDRNIGFQSYDSRVKQSAVRIAGPDATDWPILQMSDGRKLFDKGAQTNTEVRLLSEDEARPPIRQPYDNEIQPVNHWFRANQWLWGRTFVYTTDRTARTSSGDYEMWAFPVKIGEENASADARPIQKISLKLGGKTIYEREESLRSLTLLLPANLNGQPYELSVNGGAAVKFDVGLKPLVPGSPTDVPLPVDAAIPGTHLRAKLSLSSENSNPSEWADDLKNMANWKAPAPETAPQTGMARWLNSGVSRSPIKFFTSSMQAGMSGGHRFGGEHTVRFEGTPQEYADHLASLGLDFIYDTAHPENLGRREWPEFARAAQARGLGVGVNPTIPGNLDILANPNLAFLSTYLPEWGTPAYRDAQLLAQRFSKYPNFGGLLIGADNAGYVTYWDWAATIPDRPWARAFEAHMKVNGWPLQVPVGPGNSPSKVFEKRGTQREFLDYIAAYDKTFGRYNYFSRAIREANPRAHMTTGSYGSSPGVGARGGWPWASIPARPMNDAIVPLTAYDWNEQPSTKPMHVEALADRLKSEYPGRPLQILKDDFGLHLTRETRQRAYATALSRGIQGLGTTFLAHPKQRADKLHVQDDKREMSAWIRSMSGAYSLLQPSAQVGILYVHEQAISRPIRGETDLAEADLLRGSHEGKTTEALFMAHAAGFNARIVTPGELKRGLPSEMRVLLLVGLNRFDDTWLWSNGIETQLRDFAANGGVLVREDETVMPNGISALAPGLKVRSFVVQNAQDQTQMLLDRNADNIQKLRAALGNLPKPLAHSGDPKTWVLNGKAGDLQLVTLVNQATRPAGEGATSRGEDIRVAGYQITENFEAAKYLVPAPRTAQIEWSATNGVIYDLKTQKRLSPAQAATVDFTKDAAQFLAVAPRAVTAPRVTFSSGQNGFWSAQISVGTPALRGVPVQIDITQAGETVSVFGASETPIALPLPLGEAANAQIVARENLSGLQTRATLQRPAQNATQTAPRDAVKEFWARKTVPLVIALAPGQSAELGDKLKNWAKKSGRDAQVLPLEQVVRGLQPTRAIQRFPQWHTLDADIILLGTPQTNVLIFDQARGELLDESKPVQVTFSPFVGEKWALNLRDETALEAR